MPTRSKTSPARSPTPATDTRLDDLDIVDCQNALTAAWRELSERTDPRGAPIFSRNALVRLAELDADPIVVGELLALRIGSTRYSFISPEELFKLHAAGYSSAELKQLCELRLETGARLVYAGHQLGPLEWAARQDYHFNVARLCELARIKTPSGRCLFRSFETLVDAAARCTSLHDLQDLADLTLAGDRDVFQSATQVLSLLKHQGSLAGARKLLEFRTHDGQEILDGESLVQATRERLALGEVAEVSALKDSLGQTIFSEGEDLVQAVGWIRSDPLTWSSFRALLKLRGADGNSLFRDGGDLNRMLAREGTPDMAMRFAEIRTPDGKQAFDGNEIANLVNRGVPVEAAAEFAQAGLSAADVWVHGSLGFREPSYFSRGRKPKLLILLAENDPIGDWGLRTICSRDTYKFLEQIVGPYNFMVRALNRVSQFAALMNSVPELEGKIIFSHGSKHRLYFGTYKPKYSGDYSYEDISLSSSNRSALELFTRVREQGTILLHACETKKGGPKARNLYSALCSSAPGRRVFAFEDVLRNRELNVVNPYPLELTRQRHVPRA
ncbi:MAG: hypothetical protein K1X83_12575 [Oligoflexia bacterium]|nr:hypothetical protein [Oligoflexia bacterium]